MSLGSAALEGRVPGALLEEGLDRALEVLGGDVHGVDVRDLGGKLKPPGVHVGDDDVARTVLHMASLPLQANIPFVTVMATKMPFVGRG